MTSTTYGEVSSTPSTTSPPSVLVNELCAASRTCPLNCIASAEAIRRPWTMLRIVSARTRPETSVIVMRMPGPVTGTRPASTLRVSASLVACSSATFSALVSETSSSRASSRRVISARARREAPARPDSTLTRSCSR